MNLLVQLLILALLLITIAALISPFESLGWWAGWYGPGKKQRQEIADARVQAGSANHYLVYLSGIGAISGDFLEKEEIAFLDNVAARVPGTALVRDVFPYAMNNNGLTGQRSFATLWRWIVKLKLENKALLTVLINLRNVFQVMVSADPRYGPVYNYGTAHVIFDGLIRHGYPVGSGKLVTILGFSGGAQIAIGAATYLEPMLKAPIRIICFGGVMADDPGLYSIEHLYQLYGSKDIIQPLGAIAYAGRWPLLTYSAWNKVKAEGRITLIPAGPVTHNDPGGYFLRKPEIPAGTRAPEDDILDMFITLFTRPVDAQNTTPDSQKPAP